MDLTPIFVELINYNQNHQQKSKNDLFTKKKSMFNTKLLEIVSSVTCMRDYLVNNKKDYINI